MSGAKIPYFACGSFLKAAIFAGFKGENWGIFRPIRQDYAREMRKHKAQERCNRCGRVWEGWKRGGGAESLTSSELGVLRS